DASGRNNRYGMTQSRFRERASNLPWRSSDCFLNASISAILSGDRGVPGASAGVESFALSAKALSSVCIIVNHIPLQTNRRTASRRVIIIVALVLEIYLSKDDYNR